ncbi:MAG: CbiX/SirB N-terminal domain-containing protein, partial [Deltaproteobacteria bacterium]|nr:CbiX/SirB N-terminal domain-containing protein [Deltaproteobacteria bacterium]
EALPDDLVRHAHMESAEPTLTGAFEACAAAGAVEIVIHPYFLGPGRHTTRDIPRLVAEAAARHPGLRTRLAEPLGVDAKIVEVVLERVRAARPADD